MNLEFNLLPADIQERSLKISRFRQLRITAAILAAGILLAMIAFITWQQWAERKIKNIDQTLLFFGPQLDSVHHLQQENMTIRQQLAAIEKIQKNHHDWAKILQNVNDHLPAGLWLTHFAYGNNKSIEIKGMAESLSSVGALLYELNNNDVFSHFSLQSAQEVQVADLSLTEFELTGTLNGGSE